MPINIEREIIDAYVYGPIAKKIYWRKSPEEVGTVVWIKWGWDRESNFSDLKAKEMVKSKATVSVIDVERKKVLTVKVIQGDDLFKKDESDSGFDRSWPVDKVVKYLKSLPRR